MAEQTNELEQQVEALILSGFAQGDGNAHDTNSQDDTGERAIIDVDLYRLEGGAVLLVPSNGTNPLETNAIDSQPAIPAEQETPATGTPSLPLADEEPQEETELPQDVQPAPARTSQQRERLLLLVPLVLIFVLLAPGSLGYLFLLPLTATATVTITPKAKSLHTATTLTIATRPTAGQVQGRPLAAISLTRTATVPTTGHAHNDATPAAGIITFYNADSSSYTIPAGTSFTVQGMTVVTDGTTTVQAVVPPLLGTAYVHAHVLQAGSAGNIDAHTISTRCCGSPFVMATNTTPFSGGQDARSYSYIQTSDIQNAASTLRDQLTPHVLAQLNRQIKPGEQIVTPVCTPTMKSSQEPGTEGPRVTVSVTQTCTSVAYQRDSLQQVATSTLAQIANLTNYQEVGTVQVTITGSTYTKETANLQVTMSGAWVYHFTQAELTAYKTALTGKSQNEAQKTLERHVGVAHASIHIQRLDFRDNLPADPQRISVQFLYLVL